MRWNFVTEMMIPKHVFTQLQIAALLTLAISGCTQKKEVPRNPNEGSYENDYITASTPERYKQQADELAALEGDVCTIKKYCKVFDGELFAVMEECSRSNPTCGNDISCKSARANLSDPVKYVDAWLRRLVLKNSSTQLQIVSYAGDGKPGGIGLDADIIQDVHCK